MIAAMMRSLMRSLPWLMVLLCHSLAARYVPPCEFLCITDDDCHTEQGQCRRGVCTDGTLALRSVQARVASPPNALYVLVVAEDGWGAPHLDLASSSLSLVEDDVQPALGEGNDWSLLSRGELIAGYHLLLVDQVQIADDGDASLFRAYASHWLTAVLRGPLDRAAIYVYTGHEQLQELLPWSADLPLAVAKIAAVQPIARDHSSNVFGSLIHALTVGFPPESRTDPLCMRALYAIVQTTDHAHRATGTEAAATAQAQRASTAIFVVGVQHAIDEDFWRAVALDRGAFRSVQNASHIDDALAAHTQSFHWLVDRVYPLAYCSPSRSGTHTLTIHGPGVALAVPFDASRVADDCDAAIALRNGSFARGPLRTIDLLEQVARERCHVGVRAWTKAEVDRALIVVAIVFSIIAVLLGVCFYRLYKGLDVCCTDRCLPGDSGEFIVESSL